MVQTDFDMDYVELVEDGKLDLHLDLLDQQLSMDLLVEVVAFYLLEKNSNEILN